MLQMTSMITVVSALIIHFRFPLTNCRCFEIFEFIWLMLYPRRGAYRWIIWVFQKIGFYSVHCLNASLPLTNIPTIDGPEMDESTREASAMDLANTIWHVSRGAERSSLKKLEPCWSCWVEWHYSTNQELFRVVCSCLIYIHRLWFTCIP